LRISHEKLSDHQRSKVFGRIRVAGELFREISVRIALELETIFPYMSVKMICVGMPGM
jgi:hypothetical protein